MRKIFSVFYLVIIYSVIVLGQPVVDIPLVAIEDITQNMAVGLDPTATNCIDTWLGEQEAPPPPPPGAFHIIFDLAPYGCPALTVWKDYRNAPSFPYTGQVEHTLSWQRSATGTSIDIQYNLPNGAAMTIKDQVGGIILNLGPFTGSGTATIPGSYPFSSALLIMDYTAVPVELTSFSGIVVDGGVMLNWTTATELNNQGFDVERKSNTQGSWERLGFVPGNGTTTEPQAYSYLDQNVPIGSYSYRLKQIDFSGAYEYSDEIVVNVGFNPTEYVLFQNYPNPFNPATSIQFQVPSTNVVNIKIYNVLGQEIRTLFNDQVEAGRYTVTWDGLNDNGVKMSSGSYIYRMTAGDFVDTKEMILLK